MHDWSKIVSAGVGPIIVISACGLLCLAFYNRLATVVMRLRAMHREQIAETERLGRARRGEKEQEADLVHAQEMLGMLKLQTERIERRARLLRSTLMCLLGTIACLALCSLCVGLSTIVPALLLPAAVLFIVGMLLVVLGVGFAMAELARALDPVELESRFVTELSANLGA
jgi:hypothetical protein